MNQNNMDGYVRFANLISIDFNVSFPTFLTLIANEQRLKKLLVLSNDK